MNAHAAIPKFFPALVLNADFRPLSYYPLSLWSWQETVKAVFLDRVNIVSEYDRFVRSPSFEMRLPSVVSLKTYVKPALLSRLHPLQRLPARRLLLPVLRRQGRSDLRPPHPALARRPDPLGQRRRRLRAVQPHQGRPHAGGGGHAPACSGPTGPTVFELHRNGRLFPPNYLHQSWLDYLYWDTELEP